MAGEGLFFTGVVLKNNRDLLAEEAAREQLKLQKEQLELQKENAAARRRKERLDGKVNPKNYSLDNMDPFLAEQFQSQVGDYTKFVKDNSLDIQDSNELATEQSRLEGDLDISSNMYKSISGDLTSLNSLAAGNNSNNLKLAEDGTYLYQYNYNKIQEEVKSDNMTLNEALQSYPVDAESMVKQSPFTPPYLALIEEIDLDKNREITGENKGGYNVTRITKDNKQKTEKQVASSLKINSFGGWDDNAYQRVYNTEQLEVGGNRINAKDAFFQEAYVSPENPNVIGGVTSPSETLMSQLDPTKENFNKELSDQYADYLSKKIMERELANRGGKQGSKFVKEPTSEESSLSKDSISLLESPSEQLKNINNISVKLDDNKSAVVRDVTKVSVFLEDLQGVEGQNVGDKETTGTFLYNKNWYDSDSDSIEANLQRIALTEDNKPVAVMEYKGSSFLVPLGRLDSSLFKNKFEKGSTGAKIIEYSNLESSQQGGGAKVPGELD